MNVSSDDRADDVWGGAGSSAGAPELVIKPLKQPPVRFMVVAACMVVISTVLMPATAFSTHVIGYVAGSLITVGLLALYTSFDQRSRLSAWYSAKPHQQTIRPYIAVAGIVVAAFHAWYIAIHFAS
jgi:hypothetical protein